ncbi:Transposase [Paraburkholderia lycopersici]|uniref:Transposase n=1 Tax=Paraburkholderia lycopersici TaxID=416944 RepID=A0A1G6ZPX2_9BURK|nr:Transposase [Paraburkholderia lycopersici]
MARVTISSGWRDAFLLNRCPRVTQLDLLWKTWLGMSVSVSEQFSRYEREVGDETQTALGGADCGCVQAGCAGHGSRRPGPVNFGISEQTCYRWKKLYAGLESNQVRELKQRQDENARLKKLVAEFGQDNAILQDVATKMWPRPR